MNVARLPFEVGQSSGIDELAGGTPEVINTLVDGGGANVRRPGRKPWAFTPGATGGVIGAFVFQHNLIYVTADRRIWRIHAGAPTSPIPLSSDDPLTQLRGRGRAIFIDDPVRLVIAGGAEIQQWQPGDILSKRLDDSPTSANDDPPLPTYITSLNNRFISNDTRFPSRLVWSDQGVNLTQFWPPLDFTQADASPDAVVAVQSNAREAFVFGDKTLQVYSVGADPFLPFITAVTLTIGCPAPYGIISFDQFFAWLDDRRRFVVSDGRSYQVLSDPVASTLRALSQVDDCVGFRIEQDSFSLLLWVFPAAGRAFYFDRTRKQWGEYRGWDGRWTGVNIGAHVYWPDVDKHIVGSAADPTLYEMAFGAPEDFGGGPIVMQRTTTFIDSGSFGQKAEDRVRYILRRGQAPFGQDDFFETTQRDDLGPFAPWVSQPLGDVSDRDPLVQDFPGGVYRRRQYKWRYSGTGDFVLAAAERVFDALEAVA